MHPLFTKASELTETIIAAAIEVHRHKGPGLIESVYEWCFLKELVELRGLLCASQKLVVIEYKGFTSEDALRFDVLVEECLLVEAKAVQQVLPIHKAQLLSYMKLLNLPVGLLINFNEMKLTDGVHRLILPGANRQANLQEQQRQRRRGCLRSLFPLLSPVKTVRTAERKSTGGNRENGERECLRPLFPLLSPVKTVRTAERKSTEGNRENGEEAVPHASTVHQSVPIDEPPRIP